MIYFAALGMVRLTNKLSRARFITMMPSHSRRRITTECAAGFRRMVRVVVVGVAAAQAVSFRQQERAVVLKRVSPYAVRLVMHRPTES
ncbi:hypothetical protein DDY07_21125 [Methylomonas sp. ZR1]|nr:hypothetical protein [Methylomonas sp. ZR1]